MRFTVSILLCLSFFSFSQPGSKQAIGPTQSILNGLVKQNIKASSNYTLLSCSGDKIPLFVEDFYYKDGVLSMSGKARESENSLFILKGTVDELYGWVLLKDENIAFEYTTDDKKNVIVEQVPVSKVFCVDDFDQQNTEYNAQFPFFPFEKTPPVPHVGKYSGTNLNTLQSLPGATKVLYMDITAIMNGETPISQTKEEVWYTWQCIAGAYSMYEVNVTTDKQVYQKAGVPNSGLAKFLNTTGRSNSPVNAFGTTQGSTVYKKVDGYDCGRTGAHELGHVMGVYDYGGTPGGTYFVGFPEFKWVPIMGNYRMGNPWGNDALYQWSKGEYNTATVKSDFLAIANKNLPYRKDDIPQTVPLKITETGKVSADSNYGQISPNTDSDGFTFEIFNTTGNVDLKVDRIEHLGGAMLDIDASILDESGKVVANNNPKAARYASFKTDLQKGKYTLLIKGGAEGTPQTGFSTYGSLGFYGIEGTITGATEITTKTIVNNHSKFLPSIAGSQVKIDLPKYCKFNKILVFSINGKQMFYSKENVKYIDLSGFARGIYTINVGIDGINVIRKIVKK